MRLEKIVNLRGGGIFGYEVLYRGKNNEEFFRNISPDHDFEIFLHHARGLKNFLYPDELEAGKREKIFFFNLKPATLLKKAADITKVIRNLPFKAVIELTEDWIEDSRVKEIGKIKEENGILLCLDDFGRQASNFDRIGILSPQFVKIEMSLFKHTSPNAVKSLSSLISKLHPSAMLIGGKIEKGEDLQKARRAGIYLAQGFYLR